MDSCRISQRPVDESIVDSLVAAGLDPLKARLVALRGVDAEGLESFLNPSAKNLLDASLLPGVTKAAENIIDHAVRPGRIVIFGDYDCDGVCATAILSVVLSKIFGPDKISTFLPERIEEGYGMTSASIQRMLSTYPDAALVVTVDNGINSVSEVDMLKAMGVDVIVTDHHLPGDKLPNCILVNPRVDSPDALKSLCGAGVAFMLSSAITKLAVDRGLYSGEKLSGPLIVLAGLATVTDIMPITGQNRILVSTALKLFRRYAPVGLAELYARAAMKYADVLTAKDFGFLLGPRINAAGRMASGTEALNLVLAEDREEARNFAIKLDMRNSERKTVEQTMTDDAVAQIIPFAPAQVVNLPYAHQGVAGIVASRLMEKLGSSPELSDFKVPVCVIVDSHGSARAPEGYNLRAALEKCSEVLDRFGGHAAAAGFSVKSGCEAKFAELFSAACREQRESIGEGALGAILVDAVLEPNSMAPAFALDTAEFLTKKLEPFGEENPEPVFAFKSVHVAEARTFGEKGRHLQLKLHECPKLRAVWWNAGEKADELRQTSYQPRDLVFALDVSDYGERHAELRVKDILSSASQA